MLSRQLVFKLLLWRARRLNLQHHQLCIHYIQAGVAEDYVYSFAVLGSSSLCFMSFAERYNGLPHSLPSTVDFQTSSIKWR